MRSTKPSPAGLSTFGNRSWFTACVALLFAMHAAGIIGLNWSFTRPLFSALVPFNLLTTAAIVLFFHRGYSISFIIFCVITFLAGFLVEVAGVKTGVIFGSYAYGPVLGWKLWDTPLLIGCNWLTLIYCTGTITHNILKINWLKPIVGAMLMVLIDILIEPVAMHLNFWSWQDNAVPLRNYAGWFAVSLLLQILFQFLVRNKNNPVTTIVYLTQFVFFLACNLFIWFR